MGQLNVGYLQGTSNSGFKITLTKESTISHEGDVRFLTSQSYQDLPVYGSKNFLAHKFYPLDLFTPNPNDASKSSVVFKLHRFATFFIASLESNDSNPLRPISFSSKSFPLFIVSSR